MEEGLKAKTGHDLAHWKKVLIASGLQKHGEMLKFLKTEHGFTHGFANFVALKTREADAASFSEDDLIANQYKGKEALKPIYDQLKNIIVQMGNDVEVAPKKSAVSFRRKKQFALVQASTKTRIDLGLKFKDKAHGERLEKSGPFGTMCSHRVQLTATDQIDQELINWLKEAYEEAG